MTIHDDIDNYLAADLHGELSNEERNAFHTHLVECADCRQAHQETKAMNKVLEEKLENEKPDVAFENRMLAHFRNRAPQRRGFMKFIADIPTFRVTRVAAFALLLLALVELGKNITGEGPTRERFVSRPAGLSLTGTKAQYADASARYRSARADLDQLDKQVAAPALSSDAKNAKIKERDEKKAEVASLGGELNLAQSSTASGDIYREFGNAPLKSAQPQQAPAEQVVVAGSNVPTAEEVGPDTTTTPIAALANRKLIRNATVEVEIVSFDQSAQKITAFANEEKGYVATTSSEKQENGKLKGEIVVKVLPENLDRFLQKIRGLGELKNQTLGTEDITKNYFDTESRLKNSRVMEQRLIDMLKKKSDDVNDLLQVEKELGRVREEIEKMQGDLKFWDSQVQFATVTISLAEKDLEEAAKYLLKERAQLALYTAEVEKVYNDLKTMASAKVQITNAQLDRDNTGRVSARVSMLIAPEESDGVIAKAKAMGRVENFQLQTQRVAQGGEGMSENANTKRDKVELNITISRDEQEEALQQTTLRIRTSSVDEKTKALRALAEKQGGRVRNSSFSRDPDGREFANVTLRVPIKNYSALMQSFDSLGKVENVSVQRQDRPDVDLANAPADLSIQVYSQGNIVSSDTGLIATLRRTIAQSAGAIMWSLRMIGVAIAFLAPWIVAVVGIIWIVRRIRR
jgi:hypothetical protein